MSLMGPPLTVNLSLHRLLESGLGKEDEGPAIRSVREELSWLELDRRSDHLAAAYLDCGLKPGDRIASLMPNRPALMVHYVACIKSGLVATPLNYRYMPPEIDHALEVSRASLIVAHAEREADLMLTNHASRLTRGIVRYGAEDFGSLESASSLPLVGELEDLMTEAANFQLAELPEDHPQFIYFTSGSTGKPKGVTHSRSSYAALLSVMIQSMDLSPQDRLMPASSFSHIGGSAFGLATVASGGQLLMPRSGDAADVHPLMKEHHPSVMWMLPSALINLIRDHDAERDEFRDVRLCLSGGDKVSAKLEEEFVECTGIEIDEGYGMTEIGSATLNPIDGENRIGAVGKLCPGTEASLRDEEGREVDVDETGRLWVRTPAATVGYWGNDVATSETIVDGWLDTGDMMSVDADSFFWFHGRKKQIIVHDGSNICPQEVEEALAAHPAVRNAGVVGVHDLVHGENVRAYVSIKEGCPEPTPSELIAFARERIGYKAPEQIHFLQRLPFNATGKVDRVSLKKLTNAQLHGES